MWRLLKGLVFDYGGKGQSKVAIQKRQFTQKTLNRLTFATGLFAILTALLLGIGRGSLSIPLLVSMAVVVSWIYTDWLEWIQFNKYFAYCIMVLAACYATFEYLSASDANRMFTVAYMLVYVQLPLLFLRKNRRVFEQIGVFLLLELVVASLVNDNVLFGVLLLPALFVGVLVLNLFSIYVTSSSEGAQVFRRYRLIDYIRIFLSGSTTEQKSSAITFIPQASNAPQFKSFWRSIPLTLAVVCFAIAFFYILPRTGKGSFQPTGFGANSVGFSESMTLGQMGQVLQNQQPVFRASFYDKATDRAFRPSADVYIRGAALSVYSRSDTVGNWARGKYQPVDENKGESYLPLFSRIKPEIRGSNRETEIRIKEIESLNGVVPIVPPFFSRTQYSDMFFVRTEWTIRHTGGRIFGHENHNFVMSTYAFKDRAQSPYLISDLDFEINPNSDGFDRPENASDDLPLTDVFGPNELDDLTSFSTYRMRDIITFRDRVLERQGLLGAPLMQQARAIEDYFKNSGEFSYTLDLTLEQDDVLDPVVDFIRNHKRGHCQYFATAMCMILRSMGVPARIVNGFRPQEFNDVGKFYLVRQSDAHSWCECYLTRKQLTASGINLGKEYSHGAWVRFDATTGSGGDEGSVGGSETFEAAQELWNDYVLQMDQSSQSGLYQIYDNSYENNYSGYVNRLRDFLIYLQAVQFQGDGIRSSGLLRWPILIVLIVVIVAGVVLYRFMPPFLLPKFLKRSSRGVDPDRGVKIAFFRNVLKNFKRLGFRRRLSTTMNEIQSDVDHYLESHAGNTGPSSTTKSLVDAYHSIRFGGLSENEIASNAAVVEDLKRLESLSKQLPKKRDSD